MTPQSAPSRQVGRAIGPGGCGHYAGQRVKHCSQRIAALRNKRLFMMRRSINLIISKEVLLLPNFLAATNGTPPPSRWSGSKPGASSRAGLFVFSGLTSEGALRVRFAGRH